MVVAKEKIKMKRMKWVGQQPYGVVAEYFIRVCQLYEYYLLVAGYSPLFQLVNVENGSAQFSRRRVSDLGIEYVSGWVVVEWGSRISQHFDNFASRLNFIRYFIADLLGGGGLKNHETE